MEPYLRLIRGPEGNLPLALGDWVCDLHMAEVLMHLETDVESLEWDSLSDSEPFQPTGSLESAHLQPVSVAVCSGGLFELWPNQGNQTSDETGG